nr:hypothetical protein CFP56_23701 [Quercus suber]
MSREDAVRSSELETGFSSSEDRRALKVTSPSTFYKAWDVRCVLRGKDKVSRLPPCLTYFFLGANCLTLGGVGGGSKIKATSKVSITSFWKDTRTAMQKAHDVIFVEDLEPLMGKPSSEVMSSHVRKLMQVLGESLYISGKYLDYNKKLIEAQSRIASLSIENESLTIQVSTLVDKVKKGEDHLKTLEENIDTEKASSKLKDKQIDEALMKVDKACFEAVEKFKDSDKFLDKLYDYYVDGFELFRKYLKHHLEMDLSQLDMEEVEKEVLEDRPFGVATKGEVILDVA